MELKLPAISLAVGCLLGFNRTFMELKSQALQHSKAVLVVLIVPLWN